MAGEFATRPRPPARLPPPAVGLGGPSPSASTCRDRSRLAFRCTSSRGLLQTTRSCHRAWPGAGLRSHAAQACLPASPAAATCAARELCWLLCGPTGERTGQCGCADGVNLTRQIACGLTPQAWLPAFPAATRGARKSCSLLRGALQANAPGRGSCRVHLARQIACKEFARGSVGEDEREEFTQNRARARRDS
jgi:hypothetical protein